MKGEEREGGKGVGREGRIKGGAREKCEAREVASPPLKLWTRCQTRSPRPETNLLTSKMFSGLFRPNAQNHKSTY